MKIEDYGRESYSIVRAYRVELANVYEYYFFPWDITNNNNNVNF